MLRKTIILVALALLFGAGAAEAAEETVRCWNHELQPYRDLVRSVPPDQMVPTNAGDHPMAPPDNPDVGDSWLWYTWLLNGFPVYEEKMCTVRGEGENVYVVVEDSQWLTNVDQEDVDAIVEAWDNSSLGMHSDMGIYDINTTYFGPAPDALDDDPKIYVLYYDFDVAADGFFWIFDQYPDGSQQFASNECEVLYMNSSDFDPGGEYLIAVQAHEFEHQIHWLADENESSWVDEGMAELAMWLYGNPDNVSGFPNQPDNDLTDFGGAWSDYIQVYLWTLYFFEQFDLSVDAVRTVMDEPANSTVGYDNALAVLGSDRDFRALFSDWTCANYLDDPDFEDGRYGYVGEELPAFNAALQNAYPIPPTEAFVRGYAADYVRMIDGLPQRLHFDGDNIGTWAPRVLLMDGEETVGVGSIPLDGEDVGSFDLFDFGETHDTAVLVVGKYSPPS
ncbi:MAG: hypothetical protein GF346_11990, partial [Candidatus Eisenbacteria bacterium]|nr:hypothetical protein [Candidatus Latescibacterota bacterium]MBD3303157.1 hypothetical protein [Candidatus Eisenbacteria bacterium]